MSQTVTFLPVSPEGDSGAFVVIVGETKESSGSFRSLRLWSTSPGQGEKGQKVELGREGTPILIPCRADELTLTSTTF